MAVPIATTTVTIKRPAVADDGSDPYDPKSPMDTVASGVRATFSSPSGNGTSSQEVVDWHLLADPVDLRHYDTVIDDATGQQFAVEWAKVRPDPDGDLTHVVAGVKQVDGGAI